MKNHGSNKDSPIKTMSLAYQIKRLKVEKVVGFDSHEVPPGSTWTSGNLLFRAEKDGASVQVRREKWARASDNQGRAYLLWKSGRSRTNGLVLQPIDSRYCFEVFPD